MATWTSGPTSARTSTDTCASSSRGPAASCPTNCAACARWAPRQPAPTGPDAATSTVARREAIVAALDHDALPCPARGLELVVYDAAGLASPDGPAYLINLNTGARMDRHVSFDPRENPRFWFVLDVAIGRELGRALLGPPPHELFPALPDDLVRRAALDSLDWWWAHGGHRAAAVLAACTAWRWTAGEGWASKSAAARWAAARLADPAVVLAALDRREGDGTLAFDDGAAQRLVAMVRGELARTA
jgi:hypothetical protein